MPSTASVKIPLLLKFDKYVSGQTYQGLRSVAIRTYGTSYDEAMLVSRHQCHCPAGGPARGAHLLRQFFSSGPGTAIVCRLGGARQRLSAEKCRAPGWCAIQGEVGSTMEYVDDNPSSYAGDFTQETRVNDADMNPLIAFLRFIAQADDAQFASQLADWLDVDTFALYLAVNNLLVNRDSIAGMNNNYYLYFDVTDQRFIIYLWDTNESLGKLVGGSSAEYDLYYARDETGMGRGGFGGGMFGGENRLVTRFLANDAFKALYESKLTEV